jgi:hypothetical protein
VGVPANPLQLADKPDLFSALALIRLGIVAALIALLGAVLVARFARFARSTPAQRRALAPVYLSGGLVLALYAVWSVLGPPGSPRTSRRTSSAHASSRSRSCRSRFWPACCAAALRRPRR